MLLQKYLGILSQHETELKDRLARDPQNNTIRNFLVLINEIKIFSNTSLTDGDTGIVDDIIKKNLANLSDDKIKEAVKQAPGLEEELDYYLHNKSAIESLKIYIEACEKVGKIAKGYLKSD